MSTRTHERHDHAAAEPSGRTVDLAFNSDEPLAPGCMVVTIELDAKADAPPAGALDPLFLDLPGLPDAFAALCTLPR